METKAPRPTIAELFEAAGYGRPGTDIDEAVVWLFVEREWLWNSYVPELLAQAFGQGLAPFERRLNRLRKAALRYRRWCYGKAKWADRSKNPVWRQLLSLARSHGKEFLALERRHAYLLKAALRYRRKSQEFDSLVLREVCDQRDEAERERDAHAEREALAQKHQLAAEEELRSANDLIEPVWKLVGEYKEEIKRLMDRYYGAERETAAVDVELIRERDELRAEIAKAKEAMEWGADDSRWVPGTTAVDSLIQENNRLQEALMALDDKFSGGEAYLLHQSDGIDMAAVKLRAIAENGRKSGVFGGKAMEDAAQAILKLRAEAGRK